MKQVLSVTYLLALAFIGAEASKPKPVTNQYCYGPNSSCDSRQTTTASTSTSVPVTASVPPPVRRALNSVIDLFADSNPGLVRRFALAANAKAAGGKGHDGKSAGARPKHERKSIILFL